MLKFITIFSVFIAFASSRPAIDGGFIFREDDDTSSSLIRQLDVLPPKNASQIFMFHPNATRKLENGEFFQGDMVLTEAQQRFYDGVDGSEEETEENEVDGLFTRTGVLNTKYRWPKKEGKVIVPFKISNDAKFSAYEKVMIRLAMDDLEAYTCVKYTPRTNETDYIEIVSGKGCHSRVGKIGGKQEVSYQKGGCFSRGTLIHELIHALGYDHMQNHANRDKFVEIKWDNIITENRFNFQRVDARRYSNFGTDYDYNSVMHYNPKAFSKNGKETIIPKDLSYKDKIGQRRGLSPGDAQRIKNMYGCA